MARPSPEKIIEIVQGSRTVYDLDTDSRIREAANGISTLALMKCLERMDEDAPDFREQIAKELASLWQGGASSLVSWDTGQWDSAKQHDETPADEEPEQPSEYFLKLVFSSPDAAYFQFPLFPTLEQEFIRGASRKREGAIQHLRLELSSPQHLQTFVESLRGNPHFERVEESTAEEFWKAPSHGI